MKKFAINPPCPRPPLAPGQEADPTSIRRGEEFPKEWEKHQRKLAKVVKEAVMKFNEDSTAAAAEASPSQPMKAMNKKLVVKPSSSAMPSQPISSKPSATLAKSSAPVHLTMCQRTTGFSIASGASASSSTQPHLLTRHKAKSSQEAGRI